MQNIKEYALAKKAKLKNFIDGFSVPPHIAIVQVGDIEASNRYVKNKLVDCAECGIETSLFKLRESISEFELLDVIEKLNQDDDIQGFIVQLPLPEHINTEKIMKAISPKKDLDGFNKQSKTVPATPLGIYNYLKDMDFKFSGKNAVIIGRSDIVGKPMAKLLLEESMNTTILHSKTSEEDKRFYLKNADLVIVATGQLNTLNNSYVFKDTAIVIDVGINIDHLGKLCGDCQKDLKVAFQSPVPGGVGLLTRLALIENALTLKMS